ncbi:MAG TPA: iron-sulfur cluster assembly accessory protein [Alphaproteobacteria bacterium]|jgi:iron-sulfur cluster insertion protein|nr:iron-sulfur cluster assembly accessory protein [Alphaproteobacteria bacterium]
MKSLHHSTAPNLINTESLHVTPQAFQQIESILAQEKKTDGYLRIAVLGGGCSGFQYHYTITTNQENDDILIGQAGRGVVVDATSLPFLVNCVLDFVEDLSGAGFHISNPNAQASCGCGNSFAPKM